MVYQKSAWYSRTWSGSPIPRHGNRLPAPSLQPPFTDLIVQTQDGKTFNVAIVEDKTKVVMTPESEDLFRYSLTKVGPELETTEKETTKKLEKLKEKHTMIREIRGKGLMIGIEMKFEVRDILMGLIREGF